MPRYRTPSRLAKSVRLSLIAASTLVSAAAVAGPVVYTAFVVTDVSLDGQFYHNAAVTFTFVADTRSITPFKVTAPDGGSGSGFLVGKGRAAVRIDTPGRSVRAIFAPKQALVAPDTHNSGVRCRRPIG